MDIIYRNLCLETKPVGKRSRDIRYVSGTPGQDNFRDNPGMVGDSDIYTWQGSLRHMLAYINAPGAQKLSECSLCACLSECSLCQFK